jgi:hypothetical protein
MRTPIKDEHQNRPPPHTSSVGAAQVSPGRKAWVRIPHLFFQMFFPSPVGPAQIHSRQPPQIPPFQSLSRPPCGNSFEYLFSIDKLLLACYRSSCTPKSHSNFSPRIPLGIRPLRLSIAFPHVSRPRGTPSTRPSHGPYDAHKECVPNSFYFQSLAKECATH